MPVNQHHPRELWVLSGVYAGFAFSFGTLLSVLLIFLNQKVGLSEDESFQLFASFVSLAFVIPLLGGHLCDKYGFKNTTIIGLIFTYVGFVLISIPNELFLYLGLATFLAGNGLCTPAIWSQVGMIYSKKSPLRESGSTIFYLTFNIGFLSTNILSAFLSEFIGYYWVFFINGTTSLFALVLYVLYSKNLKLMGVSKEAFQLSSKQLMKLTVISIALTIIILFLLSNVLLNNVIMFISVILIFTYILFLTRNHTQSEAKRMRAFIILCFFGLCYLVIYQTEFSVLPEYAVHNLNRHALGIHFPPTILIALDPLFCLIIGVFLIRIWAFLSARNKNPSLPSKFGIGLCLAASGYLLLALILYFNLNDTMSILWMIPVFALFVAGELLVIPIGIAMAGQLAPENHEGLFMGTWNLMTGFSALLAGYVAYFTVVKKGEPLLTSNTDYLHIFFIVGISVLLVGILMLYISRRVKALL